MFDDVKVGRDATPEDESKGVANADHNSEVTRLLELKGKVKKGYHTYVGALPSSSRPTVSEHSTHIKEGVDVIEAVSLSNLEPLLGKGMQHKRKEMPLVHPFTPLKSYKRRKVGDSHSTEDFVVDLDPMRIIPKSNVEVFVDILTHWWVRLGTGFQIARSNLKLTSKAMDKPFEIQMKANYGQQNNSANYRVFLLKFADFISSGLDIDHIQHENMPFFILKLAIEIIRGRAFV
ncbi:hypothetical protein C1H46_023422 [Malus baccata]|uniref:Uncharacterized protein n=1 Tax=Malus baccata TaxID=106549 RepID=A0A540LWX8_MALBA|nr:hypothetical protein C1H46_023422 [Malus baccata]